MFCCYTQGMVIDGTVELIVIMNTLPLVRWPAKRMDLDWRVDILPTASVTAFEITPILHWRKKMVNKKRRGGAWKTRKHNQHDLVFYVEILRVDKCFTTVWFIWAIRTVMSEVENQLTSFTRWQTRKKVQKHSET